MQSLWDVAVIGGGPSGMMAAGRAAECGARVILFEKNASLGKKLLISGGGRCNFTNAEFNTRVLLSKFKKASDFLHSPFSQFGVKETIDFFESLGCPHKIEEGKRAFPASNKSSSIRDALVSYMKQGEVTVATGSVVSGIQHDKGRIIGLTLENGETIRTNAVIIATGGLSRPDTGSTGDGFTWLAGLGHTIIKPDPSLVPIAISDVWVKALQGVTLQDVKITVMSEGEGGVKKKQFSKKGRILFTHFGVSGPTIINMSKSIGELLVYGPVEIHLDIAPTFDHGMLNEKLQNVFKTNSNKIFKSVVGELVPVAAMAPIVMSLSEIRPDTFCHSITREERMKLIATLKALPMHVEHLLGSDKAIVTSGGVPLTEIDTRAMQSLKYENLYLTGDILDIDRPSGGFSLQLCWTSGYVAGTHAAQQKNSRE